MFTCRSIPQCTALLTVALSTVDPCAQELAKAGQWPGGDSSGHRYFSDAYDSHLSRQPECTPDLTAR
jgi:hypothetical protein